MFCSGPLQAEESGNAGIVFLRMYIDRDSISLIESIVVPGAFKQPRAGSISRDMYYEVESKDGTVVTSGTVDDPLVRRVEYEDPDNPGTLKSKVIELSEADFVLRLNYSDDIEFVSFYKLTTNRNDSSEKPSQEFLGRVPIDLDAGGER
jgi:hypothetical protein